ncbi:MAG: Asp-tRNA(Asn)/Glu-tRNA(Gln) amidotransferase subunit GatA [Gammaproteobacteria bacterium]
MNGELHAAGARRLRDIAAAGEASPAEIFAHFRRRAQTYQRLNAFVHLAEECAAPNEGALRGVPVAHKDIFCQKGIVSSCASRILSSYRPPFDAAVVERAKDSGMTFLGRTNMDEFAMGSSGEHSIYGAALNPWDESRVPGGSSSGAAAAVAARLAPLATGTDTGGSIRQPAAFCGITGVKPTYGRVSRWGMVAFASSFDQGGALAVSAEDCALALNALCGFDGRDSTSLQMPPEDMTRLLDEPVRGMTIGVPEDFFGEGLDAECGARVREALAELQKAGAKLKEIKLPSFGLAVPAYYVLTCAEASSNLSRFDGARYGRRAAEFSGLQEMYEKSRAEGFGGEVKRRILVGAFVLSYGYYDAYYRRAAMARQRIAADFAAAFAECDLIAGPTAPGPAFPLGAFAESDPVSMYMQDIYTVPVSLAGLPAASVPCGFARGLPVGLQLIAPPLAEARLLQAAHQYQLRADFHLRMPEIRE